MTKIMQYCETNLSLIKANITQMEITKNQKISKKGENVINDNIKEKRNILLHGPKSFQCA